MSWGLPVIMGKFGFHLSSSIRPSRDTLNRKRGRKEVDDRSLKDTQTANQFMITHVKQ